ncbi:MAG: TonB-dependent receptor [Saprospiraceae bacterium]|nr:TonB-dependent receptor [Saprospiraceae bacterium]
MSGRLLTAILFISLPFIIDAQTSLAGKVIDGTTNEPVVFGTVAIYKNGVLTLGTETDLNGNYNFPDVDPGTYDVEASYVGFQSQRITGVKVLAGKATRLDFNIEAGVLINEVVVTEYKVPLIEQDNTTSGAVLTGENIRNLPTRNINALAATSAGLATADEGGAINVRGSRSNATDYYVDGLRVTGNLLPESEIEQLQVITGGVEAQYGDVTGGIISITTKGPSNKFAGGVEIESSQLTDPYNWNLIGFNASGPILRNKKGQSILGFRVAGRYQDRLDDDPPATDIFQVREDRLTVLQDNPIIDRSGNLVVAADYFNDDDVNILNYNPNEESSRIDLTAKIDARLSPSIDVSFTGTFTDNQNRATPGGWQVYNSHNNPNTANSTYRGNFRFRHRLGRSGLSAENTGQNGGSIIQNASYTLQVGYEKNQSENFDDRHGFNYFDYGYIGDFDIEWVPTFSFNENGVLQHTDYRQVLRSYTPSTINSVLANYNKALGELDNGEGINASIGDFILSDVFNNAAVFSRDNFIATNGFIRPQFSNSYGFHTNVGSVFNRAQRGDNDLYTFNGRINFDLVPGGSDKGRHNIQLGVIYEERVNRGYSVFPRGLWNVARQQVNNHIQGILPGADTVGTIDIPDFPGTALLEVSIVESADNRFYRALRERLGVPLNQYVNVDGLDPSTLSLDLFSARELNDQGLVSYFGYDYLGNTFDGSFDDFFTARDADGVRTFPVAPNRPVYTAFYIQDKFTFRDIIFRLGVRVDAYDANTRVLKDPYSLYDIMGAKEYHEQFGGGRPGNIDFDYKVYLDETGSNVVAYRDGDQWYRSNGNPVNSATEIFSGGLVFPKYQDERVQENNNFIKSPDFDPEVSFEDYETQINVMPRLAFSFPISQNANFFAHYDILVQRPPSNTLATALNYFYFTDNAGGLQNNPNLRPERTIDYEIGFQQKLTDASKLKFAAYYKELRDMIQRRTFFPVPIVNQYETYDNIDFGTVYGFSFEYELRRTGNLTLNTNYTLQFADGTGSNANSQRGLTSRGNLRTLFPLNFDERHRINMVMDFRYGSGRFYNGPRILGADVLSNFGVNLQAVAVSGRPYTAQLTPQELGGSQTAGALNGARKPWNFTLNLRVDKTFRVSEGLGLNVYCRVSNLLDRRNVINVYPVTGSPEDDGFIASANGLDKLQQIENSVQSVESYLASYQWALINPNFYSLPRRIFLGAILDF